MKQTQTKIAGDFTKGKPGCKKSGGGVAGLAGWTGSNKNLLQPESCIASTRFNEQSQLVLEVGKGRENNHRHGCLLIQPV